MNHVIPEIPIRYCFRILVIFRKYVIVILGRYIAKIPDILDYQNSGMTNRGGYIKNQDAYQTKKVIYFF
jgi:hypothetical protein